MNYELRNKSSLGFTLVELLVVIAIVGILSSLLMVNFVGARQRARDVQRKSDIRQIQAALEMYRSDLGTYPPNLGTCRTTGITAGTPIITYMKTLPCDPSTNAGYAYTAINANNNYCITACLENTSDRETNANSGIIISAGCNAPVAAVSCPSDTSKMTLESP